MIMIKRIITILKYIRRSWRLRKLVEKGHRWNFLRRRLYYLLKYDLPLNVNVKELIIHHPENIIKLGDSAIDIGTENVGFCSYSDKILMNIRGELKIENYTLIARGVRLDVSGELFLGHNTYIGPFTKIVCMHKVLIGADTLLSWDCQILDEDFHTFQTSKQTEPLIKIGNHVWVGNGVSIYKGSVVADGCVVASNSVVKGRFLKPNCLIGGVPAKVIKDNVSWER